MTSISKNSSPQYLLALQGPEKVRKFLRRLTKKARAALRYKWRGWLARPNQLAPAGNWRVWLILAGRGWGKTRTGAEYIRELVESGRARRIALVAETEGDARRVMVEGDSGLLSIGPPEGRPRWEPSKRLLTWPNGAVALVYSADEPDQLRGPQHDAAWADEPAKWKDGTQAWDNLEFGLRVGENPRIVATTTPRPNKLMRRLLADSRTVVTRGSTYENEYNLSADFLLRLKEAYEGTRLGRQEIHAELLEDTPGALWQRDLIDPHRVPEAPWLSYVVVAVDPAVSSGEDADETGIIVAGRGSDGHLYVLADLSGRFSPNRWANRVVEAYRQYRANRVIVEKNNGGEMVEAVLRAVWRAVPLKAVHASRGKIARAEPVVALYEQGRVHHVGVHRQLEDQMCAFVPNALEESPDRVDAMVWGLSELAPPKSLPSIISFESDVPLWKQRGEPPPPGYEEAKSTVETKRQGSERRGAVEKKRLRVLQSFPGTVDGIKDQMFLAGEEYDLPMGPWPLPDVGAVALHEGWAEEVKTDALVKDSAGEVNAEESDQKSNAPSSLEQTTADAGCASDAAAGAADEKQKKAEAVEKRQPDGPPEPQQKDRLWINGPSRLPLDYRGNG